MGSKPKRKPVIFFPGLHQPSDAKHFDLAFISVNRLRDRKSVFAVKDWIMDSGAFTEVSTHGGYRSGEAEYAREIRRWAKCGNLLAAVSQDYMCEDFILKRTGLTVADHQRLTIERYDNLLRCDTGCYVMPVLQGYSPEDYVRHIAQYGTRLALGAWVGVGSICKRNGSPAKILDVLMAIKMERPDLRLHGFGLKLTSLSNGLIRALLYSADSLAWSFAERKIALAAYIANGRVGKINGGQNDWRNARRFVERINVRPEYQGHLLEMECQC